MPSPQSSSASEITGLGDPDRGSFAALIKLKPISAKLGRRAPHRLGNLIGLHLRDRACLLLDLA